MFKQFIFHPKQAFFCLLVLLLLVCFTDVAKAGQANSSTPTSEKTAPSASFASSFQAQDSLNTSQANSQPLQFAQSTQQKQALSQANLACQNEHAYPDKENKSLPSQNILPAANNNSTAQDYSQETSGDIEQSFVLNRFYLSGNNTVLTARLNLSVTNIQYLRDILRDGARLTLQCHTAFYRKRTVLKNVLIDEHDFSASLRYNPLQREFLIYSENKPPLINSNLTELLQQTWGNLELPLVKHSELEKDESYVAILTLSLKHEEMPPWLGKNVLFWSDVVIAPKEYKLELEY